MTEVPPHFHKTDRISEVDIIPDYTVYTDLPDHAEEGRFAVKKNGSTYELWKWLDGAWRQVNTVPTSPGYNFKAHASGSGTSITISDLDLATDKQYQFIIHCRNVAAAGIIYANCNSDTGTDKHHWITSSYHATGGVQDANSEGATRWELTSNAGAESQTITLSLGYNSGSPMANWQGAGNGYSGDSTLRMVTFHGAGAWIDAANITELLLTHNSGSSCDWEVWVFTGASS
jgi:hypothetical protein